MADGTHIEWTDATWNIVNGCSVLSPGCTNCYAMRLAGTRLKHHPSREGLTIETKAGPVWNGEVSFNEAVLLDPLKWRRPRKIFVCAHGDLFHENVPDEWIHAVFAVMSLAPRHIFQVLTKRPERMRDYVRRWYDRRFIDGPRGGEVMLGVTDAMLLAAPDLDEVELTNASGPPQKNIWLGTSVEDQTRANERIPILLDTPAAVRWLSCEPLLGAIDLSEWFVCPNWSDDIPMDMTTGLRECCAKCDYTGIGGFSGPPIVDWVVAGGESGPGARPMHPAWARQLRDACARAVVPFLFKQWGEYRPSSDCDSECKAPGTLVYDETAKRFRSAPDDGGWIGDTAMCRVGKKRSGRVLDGVEHDGYPA
jgi:protein gp37